MKNFENLRKKGEKNKHRVYEKQKKSISSIDNAIKTFQSECNEIPVFICCVCNRFLFRKQDVCLRHDKYPDPQKIQRCIQSNHLHLPRNNCEKDCLNCSKWICVTCNRHLMKNSTPNQATVNNLSIPEQPEYIKRLNQLEKHLISPVIPFMKRITLPRGQPKGLHGPIVYFPSSIENVTKILPRQ